MCQKLDVVALTRLFDLIIDVVYGWNSNVSVELSHVLIEKLNIYVLHTLAGALCKPIWRNMCLIVSNFA